MPPGMPVHRSLHPFRSADVPNPVRKLTSYLFISLDGVVEAPHTFVRPDLYADFTDLIAETIAEQG